MHESVKEVIYYPTNNIDLNLVQLSNLHIYFDYG